MANSYADVTTLKSGAYLDISATTNDAYLRDLLEASSRMIDDYTGRFFNTYDGVKYFDGSGSIMWLPDTLSVTTLKTDEDDDATFENTLSVNLDYYLYPLNNAVKTRAEIRSQGSFSSFANGVRRGVEIDALFGYGDGDSDTPYRDSGDDLAAEVSSDIVATCSVSTGTNFSIGQTILMGSEQCYISAIATNALTIERGLNGTSATTHAADVSLYIYEYPEPIKEACLIQAMRWWSRKDSAFADVIGVPELGTVIPKKGLDPDVIEILRPYKRYA